MKKKLKLKILAGFMLLVALLVVAGTVSIIEFKKLGKSVYAIIEDNYKTIEATKQMQEALEREDSGVLLLLIGQKDEAIEIIEAADKIFTNAFYIAKNNITEENEDLVIERIENNYKFFKDKLRFATRFKIGSSDMNWYHEEIYLTFIEVKHSVDELMSLNQNSMYDEAKQLKEKSHRAIMPGIVAIIGALIFSIILNFFISRYYITPLSELADAIRSYNSQDKCLRTKLRSEDEIKQVENEVNNLLNRLNKQR
jgi:HAMP domain-containing protein